MKMQNPPQRYHAALVVLHWLIALLVLTQAVIGLAFHFELLWAPLRSEIQIHMILGIATLAAVLVRVAVRLFTPKPPAATTGSPFLDFLGKTTHALLYLFVFALTATAVLSALQANILGAVIGRWALHHGEFNERLHFLLFLLLGVLVVVHVGAALYHQLIRRDHLFARMSFGRSPRQKAGENRT